MLHFHRVTVEYTRTQTKALYDINLEIRKGEFVFLIGHSGAGKSTLLNLALKRLEPSSGTVYVNGENLRQLRPARLPQFRRQVGVVFQDHQLLQHYRVEENLAFVLRVLGVARSEWEARITQSLRVVGLVHRRRNFPAELSVGESQRVAIARALIGNPGVLLADEPTGNLDPTNALVVLETLQAAHARGTTVVVATHSRDLVEAKPTRVVVLKAGQLVRDELAGRYALE